MRIPHYETNQAFALKIKNQARLMLRVRRLSIKRLIFIEL